MPTPSKQQALQLLRDANISEIYDLAIGHSDIIYSGDVGFHIVPAVTDWNISLFADGALWLDTNIEPEERTGERLRASMVEWIEKTYELTVNSWMTAEDVEAQTKKIRGQ